jgi:hypothetical protein
MGYVRESLVPIGQHESYLIDLKIRNSLAMSALLRGGASKGDMDTLIAMSNIVEALCALNFGADYKDVAIDGREAILRIVFRAVEKLRFTPKGLEIAALQSLMELHDAQMDIITVKDMERALAYAKAQMRNKRVTKLPPVPAALLEKT